MKDLRCQVFGELEVVTLSEVKQYESGKNRQTKAYWLCRCGCGVMKVVRGEHLTSGRTISCGCKAKNNATIHGNARRSGNTPEYQSWLNMRQRINSPDEHHRKYYAGKTIAERWNSFENFLADMGLKPTPKHELDRINNNGDYEPGNCRWVTRSENMKNTRRASKYN